MTKIPEVGETYQHKAHGEICISKVAKLGRGYRVHYAPTDGNKWHPEPFARLRDFQKAVTQEAA